MKIDKNEIQKLADAIKINVTNSELESLEESIADITKKLDELLEIKAEVEPKTSGVDLENIIITDHVMDVDNNFINSVNNFDGEYVHVKKVIGDE